MYLSTYEKLRKKIISKGIQNAIHLGSHAFGNEVGTIVQAIAFVFRNKTIKGSKSTYVRLVDYNSITEKEKHFFDDKNRFSKDNTLFLNIPNCPIAYWVEDLTFDLFAKSKDTVAKYALGEGKNVTTNNAKYILYYWEVDNRKIGPFNNKWLPCAMGGEYRKWYGNILNVIDWSDTARNFYKSNPAGRIIKEEYWRMSGITWGKIGFDTPNFRYLDNNQMYQETAILQNNIEDTYYILSLLNSSVVEYFLTFLSPTINFQLQDICSIPLAVISEEKKNKIAELGKSCVSISMEDWNYFELSMDFEKNALIRPFEKIEDAFNYWEKETLEREKKLLDYEREINLSFIDAYGLNTIISIESKTKSLSLRGADLHRDIVEFISYFIGCLFGRFSLDKAGLTFAGGELNTDDYITFVPDKDGIVPISEGEYFKDDIVCRFVDFVKILYGSRYIEENLSYIANNLGTKGQTSREKIRNYFLNEFYKDHCNMYSITGSGKRPIYWLFDSGKENGFKCLIYLHRYNKDTVGLIRTDYLVKAQNAIENALKNTEYVISTSGSAVDKAQATKQRDKYIKQLAELRTYYQALSHVAQQRIELDLNDGVKANYAKFQGIEVSIEGEKKQTINLLA